MPRLQLLGAAVLFSSGGFAIKSCQLNAWQVACFRCAIAAATLYLLLPAARRFGDRRAWLVGFAYAGTMILFVQANKATTAANAIFLQSAAPLYILMLSPWLLGERIRLREVLVMVAIASGLGPILFAAQDASATAPAPALGNALGASAGIFWALTLMGLRWLATTSDDDDEVASATGSAVVIGNFLVFAVCLPMALPVSARPVDWAWILFLGIFQIGVAYLLLTRGMRRVPAFEASVLLLVEPMLNPIWTAWWHREIPSSAVLFGGALILGAATVNTWLASRRETASLGAVV